MTAHTVTIRFKVDRRGKRIAHYWGAARRWLPVSVAWAELKLATDPRYRKEEIRK